jgi:hypothetical protein
MRTRFRLTFDRSAAELVLKAFNCHVNDSGVVEQDTPGAVVRCAVCHNVLTVDTFSGIIKSVGMFCNRLGCWTSDQVLNALPDEGEQNDSNHTD